MRKNLLLAVLIFLMANSLVLAQRGATAEEPVQPETTVFYFGQNLEGDVLMVESVARFDTRAPLGTVVGMVTGISGKAEIWLDSVMLVQAVEEVEEVQTSEAAENELEEAESEAIEEVAKEAAAAAEEAILEIERGVIPPSGYSRPTASFEISLANLKTSSPVRDELLKSEKYLDIANFPTAVFTIEGASEPSGFRLKNNEEISLTVVGELTLHGQTKRLGNIKVYLTYLQEKPVTKKNTNVTGNLLHVSAEFNIKLSDFGIIIPTENLLTLDDLIKVTIDLFGSTNPN
jgi:hypothetical protein